MFLFSILLKSTQLTKVTILQEKDPDECLTHLLDLAQVHEPVRHQLIKCIPLPSFSVCHKNWLQVFLITADQTRMGAQLSLETAFA